MDDNHYSGSNPASRQNYPHDDEAFDPELWCLLSAMLETCCDLLDPPDNELFRRTYMNAQSLTRIAKPTGLNIVETETRLAGVQQKLFALMVQSLSPDAWK